MQFFNGNLDFCRSYKTLVTVRNKSSNLHPHLRSLFSSLHKHLPNFISHTTAGHHTKIDMVLLTDITWKASTVVYGMLAWLGIRETESVTTDEECEAVGFMQTEVDATARRGYGTMENWEGRESDGGVSGALPWYAATGYGPYREDNCSDSDRADGDGDDDDTILALLRCCLSGERRYGDSVGYSWRSTSHSWYSNDSESSDSIDSTYIARNLAFLI